MTAPHLTIFFCDEVADWDRYLSRQFENNCDETTIIAHENLKDLSFPLSAATLQNFSDSRVVLLIISPAFLDFLCHKYKNAVEIGKRLKPEKTVALLCGVQESDVTTFHKDALVSYDDWCHLVAKDRDLSTVCSVIAKIRNLLAKLKDSPQKPGFKFVPRKVQPGNGKVYVILDKPTVEEDKKLKIFLEVNGMKEVTVKRRNPYNWHFTVPDNCMKFTSLLKVHVYYGERLIGVSHIKCESKMGELFKLLSDTNSPYELMCTTLGMESLHDVDEYMATAFKKLMPYPGLFFLQERETTLKWKKSKEELPTLLHFAARYGLTHLTKEILHCPGAISACYLRNVKEHNPLQLASQHGYNDIANILTEFQKIEENSENAPDLPETSAEVQKKLESPVDSYDFPPTNPTPVFRIKTTARDEKHFGEQEECSRITDSSTSRKLSMLENLAYDEKNWQGEKQNVEDSNSEYTRAKYGYRDNSEVDFLKSQKKLIEIMEAYKKGASLLEVEKMHNEWRSSCQVPDIKAKETLDGLRNMYAKVQKSKLKQSSTFLELRQFIGSKLRRKDSMGSKGNGNLFQHRPVNSIESFEEEEVRPVSTLSVISSTSSSSGSSFDAASCSSVGSDSGNHSDNCDQRKHKRLLQWKQRVNCPDGQKKIGTLHELPPTPPPRPAKTYLNPNEERLCSNLPVFEPTNLQQKSGYSSPDIGYSSLQYTNSIFSGISDGVGIYDVPPLPMSNDCNRRISDTSVSLKENLDYDLVPPPLPLCAKSNCLKENSNQNNWKRNACDLLPVLPSFSGDYDFPKITENKNRIKDPHTTVIDSKSSKRYSETLCNNMNSRDKNVTFSFSLRQGNIRNAEETKSHYCNIFKNSHVSCPDIMPNDIAPRPPAVQEPEEEHYKVVGAPVSIAVSD